MTPVNCRCEVRGELEAGGRAVQLCHHSSLVEIEAAKKEALRMMTRFDKRIELQEILIHPPNEAAEYFVQRHFNSVAESQTLNVHERRIMKAGFLRYYSIVLNAMLLDALAEIQRDGA